MEFFQYANMPLVVIIFFLFIITLILYFGEKESEDKPTGMLIFGSLFFIYVAFIDPNTTNENVKENISLFKNDQKLKCSSNNYDSYIVSNDEWSLEGDYLINKQNKLTIRIDRCKKY